MISRKASILEDFMHYKICYKLDLYAETYYFIFYYIKIFYWNKTNTVKLNSFVKLCWFFIYCYSLAFSHPIYFCPAHEIIKQCQDLHESPLNSTGNSPTWWSFPTDIYLLNSFTSFSSILHVYCFCCNVTFQTIMSRNIKINALPIFQYVHS